MLFVKLVPSFFTCLVLTSSTSSRLARRTSHPTVQHDKLSDVTLERRVNDQGIYLPGETWQGLATSYDYRTDGKDGGACGYTLGNGPSLPASILGAAQQIGHFGNGKACGTCVKITPTDVSPAKDAEPRIVTILNSCPEPCHSIDIESEVVTNWFHTRLGQFNINAEVVPCGYLSQGITIQYRQITNRFDDFRMNFRLNSGSIKQAEVSLNRHVWLPLVKNNPNQYTLADYSKSRQVLSQSQFSLRFTNYKGETVVQNNIVNRVAKDGFGVWYKTSVNFKST